MQYRKCVALFAAMLVGFGVVATDAATVISVTVTSPSDSGALRGIDSTFTVQAKILDFTYTDSLEVILYLVTSNDSTVVADGENSGSKDLADAISKSTSLTTKIKNTAGVEVSGAGDGGALIAVRATRGQANSTSFLGDADSVTAKASGDTTTFTWYGKVHHTSGTVNGVRAAAIAIDPSNAPADTTTPKLSAGSLLINIDADRPKNPDKMITSATDDARGNKTGTPNADITVSGATSDVVLGILDTLKLDVKLGSQTDPVLIGDSLKVVADAFGKLFTLNKSKRSADTLNWRQIIAEGDFGDFVGAQNTNASETLAVYIVDLAGNRSGSPDAVAQGVTLGVTFWVDAKKPVLDGQVVSGDTILPASGDTITDGSLNTGFLNDLNAITYNLPETLDSLFVTVNKTVLKIANTDKTLTNASLLKNQSRRIDFTDFGTLKGAKASDKLTVSKTDGSNPVSVANSSVASTGDSNITTGVYSIKFKAQDLAGNVGPELTRTNVYVDVDDIALERLFPTAASGLDTLEEATAKVVFKLSEHADSVMITYIGISGNDNSKTRKRPLVGSELTNTASEQTFTVDSLLSNSLYTLQLVAADLSGNYTQTSLDTFVYDTTFVVPVISVFKITASSAGFGSPVLAGAKITLTLKARTVSNKAAVTYKKAAVLKVTGGSGITLSGTGVDTVGLVSGRANLTADDWIVGERVVTLIDTNSIDSLAVTVQDCTDTTNLFIGALDSTIVVNPTAYQRIVLAADDTVGQGDNFWVGVTLADKFGNVRTKDTRFVDINTGALGVQLPTGAVAITAGTGGFWANSQGYAGALTVTVRDIVDSLANDGGAPPANGNNFTYGKLSVYVSGDGATVLDAPDTLIAQDYMGASGNGDQGGFVLLTFPASDDHGTLSGYRIYRSISVDYDADSTGALVALAEPTTAMVAWGRVDAISGADIMRVVVATLDGDSTPYGVAAERGNLSTKEAFTAAEAVSTPYELMAETMLKSKEAAQVDLTAPVFATLTPEALAFSAEGVVPRLKLVGGVLLSTSVRSEAVRAIDNIPPAAVTYMQSKDTPGDAGGSITIQWAKSADDKMLTTTVPNAVGGVNTYTTVGVEGYNIYRRLGDAAWQMVGQTGAGETSFEDATVFNGVRYSYRVEARDADNVTTSEFVRSAMAIRNSVVDADGKRIVGLFGADARVDYDDFFIFADHFGLTAESEAFDSAFDLSPNNAVDYDDFFIFADNFGRVMAGIGKVVPTMAGLNSDARFYLEVGMDLPRIGEELSVAVSLENYVEVRGYGLTVEFDSELLEFVETRVVDNILGETGLAAPQVFAQTDGKVAIAAFGNTASEGDLGLNLIFRAKQEIEDSYIELTNGALQDGTYGLNQITAPVSVRIQTRPEAYALNDNYPNPFNPETTIKYQLPDAGQVRLEVYNMLGQVVKTLVDNQFQNAGRYTLQWDATNNSGQPLSSGVYFYRILAGGEFQSHKKMLLLK